LPPLSDCEFAVGGDFDFAEESRFGGVKSLGGVHDFDRVFGDVSGQHITGQFKDEHGTILVEVAAYDVGEVDSVACIFTVDVSTD
jgi:hypothetical protein